MRTIGVRSRVIALYDHVAAMFRITCSTTASLKSEEQFDFYARRIITRLRIQAVDSEIMNGVRRALQRFNFDATLGYPGEGSGKDCVGCDKRLESEESNDLCPECLKNAARLAVCLELL